MGTKHSKKFSILGKPELNTWVISQTDFSQYERYAAN